MTSKTVELRLTLTENVARKLHEIAEARGTTEETIVAEALDLLMELDDTPSSKDYWFSVAAMREDWEAMPEDWMADEMNHSWQKRQRGPATQWPPVATRRST